MSFDRNYRPVFKFVSIFGTLPISRNPTKSRQFTRSIVKSFYSVIITVVIDTLFVLGAYTEVLRKFNGKKKNGSTLFFVTTFQEIFVFCMYGCVVMNNLVIARKHADFLNALSSLEIKLQSYMLRSKYKPNDVRHPRLDSNWISLALFLWTATLMSIMERTIGPPDDKYISVLFVWMSMTHLSNALYIRVLAIFINQNCRFVRMCFARNQTGRLDGDVQLLDEVNQVKEMFVDVFSGSLIITLFYDFITILVVVFWATYTVVYITSMQTIVDAVIMVFAYVLPFLVKIFLLTNTAEGLPAEVSYVS